MTTMIDEQQNMEIEPDDNSSLEAPSDTFEPGIPHDLASVQPPLSQHSPPLKAV